MSSSIDHAGNTKYLTEDIPGIGGTLKARPEDFLVDEIPLYQPCGEGEHIYLYIEKRNMSTSDMLRIVARHFGIKERAIGYAGQKDRTAITRQTISLHTPGKTIDDFPMLRHDDLAVQWADMHTNKLRLGHSAGNRFVIRVRDVRMTDALPALNCFRAIGESGVPNRFGAQRFGAEGTNHRVGRALVRSDARGALDAMLGEPEHGERTDPWLPARRAFADGDVVRAIEQTPGNLHVERRMLRALEHGASAEDAVARLTERELRFYLSAFQSAVFNRLLDLRLEHDTLSDLADGDIAWKHQNGACFSVDAHTATDPDTRQRLNAFEISPSGPLWGSEMLRASGEVLEAETDALAEAGVTEDDLRACHERTGLPGARRPYRIPVSNTEVEGGLDEHGEYVRCVFELPPGSFATEVMREIMKNEAPPPTF